MYKKFEVEIVVLKQLVSEQVVELEFKGELGKFSVEPLLHEFLVSFKRLGQHASLHLFHDFIVIKKGISL